jgi:methanogenic corrinoid protein MtbC1
MTRSNPLAAEILETSAAGYASAAVSALLQSGSSEIPNGWGSAEWKSHLKQRILELATAIRVDEPSLFAKRINWLRRAVKARGASDDDLRSAVLSIQTALEHELPDDLKSAVTQPIALALAEFEADIEPESTALDSTSQTGRIATRFLATCLEARTTEAIRLVLDAIDNGMSPTDAYADVLLPVQQEIGQLWHMGEATISEERLVSETTRTLMSLIANLHAPSESTGRTVIAASVAGNAHDIAIRALSNLFHLGGWRSVFLGANVPSIEIAHAAEAFDADLVLLNVTLTTQLGTLSEVIEKLHQVAAGAKILVGGLAFEGAPEIWRQIGADGYTADIRSAVDLGTSLVAVD